jgi:hypothetical protein
LSQEAFEFVERHRARETDDFLFELDEYIRSDGAQLMLAHIRVFKLTPSILKQMLREWDVLRSVVRVPLFACPEVSDDKWKSFVKLFGFVPFMDAVPCVNGDVRPLYIHTV